MAAPRLLILVPARGGSKGLPRKNLRELAGRPLIGWTAAAVRESGIKDAVAILSTDDEQIADAGRRAGLQVPFLRPAALATDEATVEAVAMHALDWFGKTHGAQPEMVMLLQPTSPLRPPHMIVQAEAMLAGQPDIDGVLGVKTLLRSPATLFRVDPQQLLRRLSEHEELKARRQEIAPLYTPNGAMYLVRTSGLHAGSGFFPPRCRGLVMDAVASLDIDDEVDWKLVEAAALSGLGWKPRAVE